MSQKVLVVIAACMLFLVGFVVGSYTHLPKAFAQPARPFAYQCRGFAVPKDGFGLVYDSNDRVVIIQSDGSSQYIQEPKLQGIQLKVAPQ